MIEHPRFAALKDRLSEPFVKNCSNPLLLICEHEPSRLQGILRDFSKVLGTQCTCCSRINGRRGFTHRLFGQKRALAFLCQRACAFSARRSGTR